MAEEVEATPEKKGGNKMVIIIVAILMLITGGFVGLKMRSGGDKSKAKVPEAKLGKPDSIEEIHEFLVNLAGDDSAGKYLRTDISVQPAEGVDKDKFDKCFPAIEDAINKVLCRYSAEEVKQNGFREKLKREVAYAANMAYWHAQPENADDKNDPVKLAIDKLAADVNSFPVHKDWDSDDGPILKVYFTTFATQ